MRPLRIGLGCLALLTLAMFLDTLIAPGSRVLGDSRDDLALHFLWWREFGFGELAKGNLALWNPHIFAGAPFFGGMQPDPAPVAADTQGQARIVREGTDFMEVDAEVASPSILLVTDAWARGWRAAPLEGSSQKSYQLMPANYALRAVALDRGKHRLRLEYAPLAFHAGAVVSVMAWAAWIVAAVLLWRRERRLARA